MENKEELEEKLKSLHHASKEAKEIKAKLKELEEGSQPEPEKEQEKKQERQTMEINPNKSYLFRLEKKSTGFWVLPRRDKVWDEKQQRIREIRYSQMEESPYVDEQDEDAPEARIAPRFKDGVLMVSGKDRSLINYLLAHDANAEKGNNIAPQNQKVLKHRYRLIVQEDKILKERQFREEVRKAQNLIADADIRKLDDFMRSHFRFIQQEFNKDALINKAYEKAERYPELFTKDFNNPKHAIKATVQRGMQAGHFSVKNGLVKGKDGTTILKFNPSEKYDEALTSWVMKGSQEAKDFFEILDSKV